MSAELDSTPPRDSAQGKKIEKTHLSIRVCILRLLFPFKKKKNASFKNPAF